MSKATEPLFLDERMAAGMELDAPQRGYPRLAGMESLVCGVIAEHLFLSRSSVEWAYWSSTREQNHSGWKQIRERLMGRLVKLR